jgi:hypothetical protein
MRKFVTIRCDNRPIFQSRYVHSIRTKTFTNLEDVKEALIASASLKNIKQKEDYFFSMGLDYDRTIKYYDTVVELNLLYEKTKIENPKSKLQQLIELFTK